MVEKGRTWDSQSSRRKAGVRREAAGRRRAADNNRSQVLITKILPPGHIAGLIDRPRLVELIVQLETKQLAVITAGAGFGKTSLAATWAEYLRRDTNSVAWLALDAEDDEPTRFLFYISHALHRACDVGIATISLISDFSLAPASAVLVTLLNELTNTDDDVFLFLDDYHYITNPEIHGAVEFLLRHAPKQFHMVVTSRSAVPLPLARLRADNQLVEIDASSLRFDVGEIQEFLEHENLGLLDSAGIAILNTKTEGWPAALRIVASTASQSREDFAQYVRRLSGEQRSIGDYLTEMLAGLPYELVQFMLRTSVLDRLSGELCQAVTGAKRSSELLESVAERRMLIVPLDFSGRFYRYHALLAEYLRQRLQTQMSDEIPWLHRHAYRWYAEHELWTEAVQHAIAGGDTEQALSWIQNCAMALVRQGDLLTLLGWVHLFPKELMHGGVMVRLAIAWGMALAMRFDEALQILEGIEQTTDGDTPEALRLRCECQIVRSVTAALKDDTAQALRIATACVGQKMDPWTANVASNVARLAYWRAGDLVSFYAMPWVPYSRDEDRRNVFSTVYRLCLQGLVEVQQLRLSMAERLYQKAMQLADQHVGPESAAMALPASLLAEIRYEEGRMEDAEKLLIDRIPVIEAAAMLECVLRAHITMARVAAWRVDFERAYVHLEAAEELGQVRRWERLAAAALLERVRLKLAEGKQAEARACLNRLEALAHEHPVSTRCAWSEISLYAALAGAHIAMEENRLPDAIAILRQLHVEAIATENRYTGLRLVTQLALALRAAKAPAEAHIMFRDVLRLGAAAGISQAILDQGREIGALLTAFAHVAPGTERTDEAAAEYANSLLVRWREHYEQGTAGSALPPDTRLLTGREHTVLQLIGEGRSNKDIARNLGITPETAKSHVKNIFIKLGVDKRLLAVARGRSLGLIETR